MIYSDYDVLTVRVFTRKQAGVEEIISIDTDGGVGFLHKSKNYVAGYGASLGELNATADTILVYPYRNGKRR